MVLVDRLWTFSMISFSFIVCGDQTGAAYSRWGRTRPLKI